MKVLDNKHRNAIFNIANQFYEIRYTARIEDKPKVDYST